MTPEFDAIWNGAAWVCKEYGWSMVAWMLPALSPREYYVCVLSVMMTLAVLAVWSVVSWLVDGVKDKFASALGILVKIAALGGMLVALWWVARNMHVPQKM